MYIKYNSYQFNAAVFIPMGCNFEFNNRGAAVRKRHNWKVKAILDGATESAINTAISALETALTQDGTLTLYKTDTTATVHTITPCKVGAISYPDSSGAEFATRRTVEIEFTAVSNISGSENLLTFQESIDYSGGGPRVAWVETVEGPPRKFTTAEQTLYRASVRGSATGKSSYPTPPAAIWPGQEVEPVKVTRSITPNNDGTTNYNISWAYEFAGPDEFVGVPNTWLY